MVSGPVVRTYSSELKREVDPAVNPAAYDKICQLNPVAPDCSVPLYWAARTRSMPTTAGMHRISWNLRYQPLATHRAEVDATGAIPGRSSPPPTSAWAPAGEYTVRLTVGGQSYTQPLTLRMDPRVTTATADLAQNDKLALEMYELARDARMAYGQAHDLGQMVAKLDAAPRAARDAFKARIDTLAPDEVRGFRGFGRGYQVATTLNGVSDAALAALRSLQSADTAPTAAQTAATVRAKEQWQAVSAKWDAVKAKDLTAFNATLAGKGQPTLALPPLRMPAPLPADENGNIKKQ